MDTRLRIAALSSAEVRDVVCPLEVGRPCWGLTDAGLAAVDPATLEVRPEDVGIDVEDVQVLAIRAGRLWGGGPCGEGWCRAALQDERGAWARGEPEVLAPLERWEAEGGLVLRERTARLWNEGISNEQDLPFLPMIPSPSGGLITVQVGRGSAGGRLVHLGIPPVAAPIPVPQGASAGPGASLALHPTGREGYALVWPGGELFAFSPRDLSIRWTLELTSAAQGLFVDRTGGLMVVETGGSSEVPLRGVWDLELPTEGPPADAVALRRRVRPPAAKTLVIDLRGPRVVVPMEGSFRRLERTADGAWLLVTSEGMVRLAPES